MNNTQQYIMQMQFIGAIFDLDGVIVDTTKYHYLAWKELAYKLGFHFSEEHNEQLKGVSRTRSLEILLEVGGVELDQKAFEKALKEKNERYLEYIGALTSEELLPGAEAYIRQLRENGVRIALGSASKNAPLILKRLGISKFFDAVADGNCVSRAKPDPEVFLVAAERIGVHPGQCVVFEDSEAGIEAAISAGMKSVGIGHAGRLKQAEIVIKDLSVLIKQQKNHCATQI